MNTRLIISIAELALSLLEEDPDHPENALMDIAQKAAEVYFEHVGEPMDPAVIQPEELLT